MKLRMVFSDEQGRLYDHPNLLPAGMDGPEPEPLAENDLIPVPRGSDLMMLPGRHPVGIDPATGERVVFSSLEGTPVFAAAVFMAPAHTQSHRAAYVAGPDAPVLPLFAYTALAYGEDGFYASGVRVDDDTRQDPWRFERGKIERKVRKKLGDYPGNRLAEQLKTCALVYNCRAAQNFFLGRHEAPLPTSVACNSRCVGCLSLQEDGEFKAAHDRLRVPPSAGEIAEIALGHIAKVDGAVVSFGQGCEGEPLLNSDLLCRAVRLIRAKTDRGTINLNTNASRPRAVAALVDAGLDSIRVSVNSLRAPLYDAYYRPRGYSFADVVESARVCKGKGVFVSLNLLYFPGVTDTVEELAALEAYLGETGADLIQMRNLNIDPDVYIRSLPPGIHKKGIGVRGLIKDLKKKFSDLRFGYFNPPKETRKRPDSA
jgi:pyruvate-formate lyase-activating enzyme